MMPMYMNPSHTSQMRPQGHYHQGCGNYPHHMTMDASSPAAFEHWPTPSPCYGNCIHGNFPVHNACWPPCYPPQVPYHSCCMNHSGFQPHAYHAPPYYIHQPFPVGYQHPCTQCSSPMSYPKNDRGIVIEEHEPEIEKGNQGEAVLPVRSPNCSYPTILIPHENARNQERESSLGSRSHDQPPAEVKSPENIQAQKRDPKAWNGCFPLDESTLKSLIGNQDRKMLQEGKTVELPFDISKLKSLLQGLDGKEKQIPKNKEESGQLQYPILWIPSHGKQNLKASESMERSNEERNLNSSPSVQLNEGQNSEYKGKEGNFENNLLLSNALEKRSMRNIPVDNHLKEPRIIPVKQSDSHLHKPTETTKTIAKTEPIENRQKQQPSLPPKASKLPPVCLRVDPLPRRKNGGSKSLSPPRQKEQPLKSEATKVTSPLSSKNGETRTVPETCNLKCEEVIKEKETSELPINSTGTEKDSVESNTNLQERASSEIVKPYETKESKETSTKKTFTEEEAARLIQCWYRGYDVRRWEPIKKLKEIATVRKQMGDVKKRIQALEVSTDQHIEEKEIVILGEMVMSLLLKLDSVQGLHPSIRDHRKSLARELSEIEDKLDSLRKSSAEKDVVEEQVENTLQTSDYPVNSEHSQIAGEEKMVSDSNTEKVLPLSPVEHPMNLTDENLVAEAKEETGLSETLAMDSESETAICEAVATSTAMPEKIEEVETVLPVNPSPANGNEMTVTNIEEDKFVVEEPQHELPQVIEISYGPGSAGLEKATEVSEPVDNLSEDENEKEDHDILLPLEKDVVLSELPIGVIDDEKQLLSQDSSSCVCETKTTAMDPHTVMQDESSVDHSSDDSKGIGQESCEPREETAQPPETEVIEHKISEETKKLMEETKDNHPSEACEPQEDQTEQPQETEVTEHEILEETKRLMEENQRFKEAMETLVKAGREQLEVISKLTGRVKSLEKKLSKKKRTQIERRKPRRGKHVTNPMSEIYDDALL